MYLVFEGDILHRKEYLAELIENSSHERYLPVQVLVLDTYRKRIHLGHLTGVHLGTTTCSFENRNLARPKLRFSVVFITAGDLGWKSNVAFDRLDEFRVRASHAEKLALDTLLRVREAETETSALYRRRGTGEILDNVHGDI
jgi:hypothetical protein